MLLNHAGVDYKFHNFSGPFWKGDHDNWAEVKATMPGG